MSKFASFGLLVVLFMMLSMVVVFGFFFFTPKIKSYRALNIELELKSKDLQRAEKSAQKDMAELKHLKERADVLHMALKQRFEPANFEAFVKQYFKKFSVKSIESEHLEKYQLDSVEIIAYITSPTEYYHFIKTLNQFSWVAEVGNIQEFISVDEGIETHFVLKVYTYK